MLEFDLDNADTGNAKKIASVLRTKNKNNSIEQNSNDANAIVDVNLDLLIDNIHQPRLSYNEYEILNLASSIKNNGLLQPIGIVQIEKGYMIVFGHRRVRAHRKLNLKTIKAIIIDESKSLRSRALIENIQREGMHPIEVAISVKSALDRGEYASQADLARALSKDKSWVNKYVKLATLPKEIIADIEKNKSVSDMYVLNLIRLIEDEKLCKEIYEWVKTEKPSREEIKKRISANKNNEKSVIKDYSIKNNRNGCVIKTKHLSDDQYKQVESFIDSIFSGK